MRFTRSKSRFRRLRGLMLMLFGLALVSFGAHKLYAQSDFAIDTTVTYQVESTGSTKVIEQYSVAGAASNKYLDSITLSTPVDDAKNVSAAYADGTAIPTTVATKSSDQQGYTYNYVEVTLKFPRKNVGATPWQFSLSYDTLKLVDTKGTAHTVYVPAIAASAQQDANYTVYVTVPKDFAMPHSSGVVPTSEGITNGRAKYSFTQQDLAKQAIALTFGDQTVYNVNFNFPLRNDGAVARTMTVTLPPDTSSQKVYINSLDPKPKATRLDSDGNILADFTVPARTTITVKTNISAVVKYLEYDLSAGGAKGDIPADLVKTYTAHTRYWQTLDPDIVIKAKQAAADIPKVADQIKAIQKTVVDTLSYNDKKIKYNVRQGAAKALQNPTNAVCLEYSDLMIALLRAQGIPARMPVGYAYTGDLKASKAVSDSLHSWVEAYIPNVGWINVDPTWGEKYDNFGKSDLDHLAFALWGASDSSPAAVMVGTADTGYQYEATTISYAGELPKPKLTNAVVGTRWVILPYVSVVQYKVSGPAGVAGDNYELVVSGALNKTIELGSLAPSQQVAGYMPLVGAGYLGAVNLAFKQTGDVPSALSSASAQSNYLPLIGIIALVIVICLLLLLKWILKRRKARANAALWKGGKPEEREQAAERSTEEILKDISVRTKKIQNDSDQSAK